MYQSPHLRLQSQQSVSIQDSNRVGAQDTKNPAMSVLSTPYRIQNWHPARSKLSCGFIKQNFIFEGSQELKEFGFSRT
jgi:hypothetical protein